MKKLFKKNKKQQRERIWELDFVRGISMMIMFIFHYHFFISIISGFFYNSTDTLPEFVVASRNFFYNGVDAKFLTLVFMFPLMSGITTSFDKHAYKPFIKAIKFLLSATAISVVTYILSTTIDDADDLYIIWGIIHNGAISMTVYAILNLTIVFSIKYIAYIIRKHKPATNIDDKIYNIHRITTTIVFLALGLTVTIVGVVYKFPLDDNKYDNTWAFLGLINNSFSSADYFPFFPYSGYFFLGVALGRILYDKKRSLLPKLTNNILIRPYKTIGRYSMSFYFLHTILLFVFFYLYFSITVK